MEVILIFRKQGLINSIYYYLYFCISSSFNLLLTILKTNTMSTFKKAKAVILPTNQQTKYLMVYSDVEKTKNKLILTFS